MNPGNQSITFTNTLKMKKLHLLTLIGACSLPSLAYANISHVDGGLVVGILGIILLAIFLFFFLIAHFRDRQHRFRYSFICISSMILSVPFSMVLASLISVFNMPFSFSFGSIFISSPLFFLIIGIIFAEHKAKEKSEVK